MKKRFHLLQLRSMQKQVSSSEETLMLKLFVDDLKQNIESEKKFQSNQPLSIKVSTQANEANSTIRQILNISNSNDTSSVAAINTNNINNDFNLTSNATQISNQTQLYSDNYTLNISISSLINNQTTNQLNISNSSVYANYLLFNISNLLNYTFANLNNNTTKSSFNLTSNATQISNQTQFMNATNSSSSISPITNSPFQCYSYAAANSLSLFNITDFMNVSNCSYTNYCTFEITV